MCQMREFCDNQHLQSVCDSTRLHSRDFFYLMWDVNYWKTLSGHSSFILVRYWKGLRFSKSKSIRSSKIFVGEVIGRMKENTHPPILPSCEIHRQMSPT